MTEEHSGSNGAMASTSTPNTPNTDEAAASTGGNIFILGQLQDGSSADDTLSQCLNDTGTCTPIGQAPVFPLSALGLDLVVPASEQATEGGHSQVLSAASQISGWSDIGASLYVAIEESGFLKTLDKGAPIINTAEGKQIVKVGLEGSKHVPTEVVNATPTELLKTSKRLAVVKGVGVAAGFANIYISNKKRKRGEISNAKFVLDVVMVGVGFIPGWGWVVSGLYFIIDEYIGWERLYKFTKEVSIRLVSGDPVIYIELMKEFVIDPLLAAREETPTFPDVPNLPLAGIAEWQRVGFTLGKTR